MLDNKIKWPKDCCLFTNDFTMRAEIQDKLTLRFKVLVAAAVGVLVAVIALGETGII